MSTVKFLIIADIDSEPHHIEEFEKLEEAKDKFNKFKNGEIYTTYAQLLIISKIVETYENYEG